MSGPGDMSKGNRDEATVIFLFVYAMLILTAGMYLILGAGYLLVGLGYVLYYGSIGVFWILVGAGWLIWQTGRISYRVLDWSVDKLAPPIAARWHRWRDCKVVPEPVTPKWPPVKEANPEIVHWGFGHLNPARFYVRVLPAAPSRRSCAVARRSRRVPAGSRRRSLRG